MKRNLVLLSVLGLMLGVAWYGDHREKEVSGVFGFAPWEEVDAIHIPGVALKKLQGRWLAFDKGARPVDVEKVQELWGALGKIWTEREITDSGVAREEAFPSASDRFIIHFGERRLEILLGNRLPFDQSFYLETVEIREDGRLTRQWIARDTSPEPGIYNVKTVYRSPAKYQRLKSLLELKADDFELKEGT